ncbi:hypothetical protein K502DRAFT_341572 [Neoconidiobolus thromboides FSU 785]|nr:hypothetical protein K502DRAFT_341572 [Neoconidiobolus thromboides FSU 785]
MKKKIITNYFKQITFLIHPDYFQNDITKKNINQLSYLKLKQYLEPLLSNDKKDIKEEELISFYNKFDQKFHQFNLKPDINTQQQVLSLNPKLKKEFILLKRELKLYELSQNLEINVDEKDLFNVKHSLKKLLNNNKDKIDIRKQFLMGLKKALLNPDQRLVNLMQAKKS